MILILKDLIILFNNFAVAKFTSYKRMHNYYKKMFYLIIRMRNYKGLQNKLYISKYRRYFGGNTSTEGIKSRDIVPDERCDFSVFLFLNCT